MKRSNLSIAVYLLLLFATGVVVGAFGSRLLPASAGASKSTRMAPEEWRRGYVKEMNDRLKLTPDQNQNLDHILDETMAQFRDVHKKFDNDIHQIKQTQIDKIDTILNGTQRTEFAKLRSEREARSKARDNH